MFKNILEYAGEYRKKTYLAIVTMLFGLIMSVIPFFLAYQIIRPLLMDEPLSATTVVAVVIAVAVCGVLYAVFYMQGLAFSHESAYNTLKNLRISLQSKLESQPLGDIQDKGTGALKKMFTDDIEGVELLLAHALPEGFSNLAISAMVYIAMFFVDWKLALLSMITLPIGFLAMGAMYTIGMRDMDKYYSSAQVMNNTIIEYVNGMEVIKVFNRVDTSYHRFEKDVKSYRDFTVAWYKVCWPWMALYSSILPSVALFALPIGAYFVLAGYSTLPDLVLILCMGFSVGPMLLKALGFTSTMPNVNYKILSLEKTLETPPLKQTDKPFSGKDHTVEFENVRFAYRGDSDEVLHGVSLTAHEENLTAFVGESGSGKSTLAKLLVHFYDLTGGTIKIGGQDIRDMSIEALNNEISYVAQEQFLYNISLMDNIRLGKLDATDDEVMEAAQKAQCDEFLARLDNGIHTLAGDGGKQLSGGERQRISLARAILKNAPIIVLDEATAFMDPENEDKMNDAIAELIEDKTVIVIAHRLHSIVGADQICVLDSGCISATGTHSELLETSPVYQRLWQAAEESMRWSVGEDKRGDNK